MSKNNIKGILDKKRNEVNAYMADNLKISGTFHKKLFESLSYSLLSNGKRLRPILFLSVLSAKGLDYKPYISFAAAIEALHCYTLIHDDLPALDNDVMRRGKLTNHKVFGEATAILAGDALLTLAFEWASQKLPIPANRQLLIISKLAMLAGYNALLAGQQADIDYSEDRKRKNKEDASLKKLSPLLDFIHIGKTGALMIACFETAAIAAKVKKKEELILSKLAQTFGLHFQIVDDIFGVTHDQLKTGKSNTADVNNQKLTYPSLYGIKESQNKAQILYQEMQALLKKLPSCYNELEDILGYLSKQEK